MPIIKNPDPTRCCKAVWGHLRFHQCRRPGVIEDNGKRWCKQHSPKEEKRRREKSDARIDAQIKEGRHACLMREWSAKATAIIQQIADGHNDPRKLAQEYLSRKPTPPTPEPNR